MSISPATTKIPLSVNQKNIHISTEGLLDLNKSSVSDLESLYGIGPVLAERIIEYRNQNGGFTSVSQLLDVNGIGEKKYERIKGSVFVSSDINYIQKTEFVNNTISEKNNTLININTADLAELQKISGIGPVLAGRIIEYRNIHGDFSSVNNLENVSGIGPATIKRIQPYIRVSDE